MDCRDNFIEQEHYTRQTIWHSFFNWRYFFFPGLYFSSSNLLLLHSLITALKKLRLCVWNLRQRQQRRWNTWESNCQRRQRKGRLMRVDEVKEWRYLSSFFIRASFVIMCLSSKWEIAQFMEELPSPTWDNHVSAIQQPALFSEAGSSPKSRFCFQQYCKILIKKNSNSFSTTTNTKLVCFRLLDGVPPFT